MCYFNGCLSDLLVGDKKVGIWGLHCFYMLCNYVHCLYVQNASDIHG